MTESPTGGYGKIAGLYDLLETLGSGHFAVVKLARHVFTGAKVAVKVVDKTKLDEVSKAHLFQEVRCMKLVQHPNVVRLYEVIDTQTKLYLVLELGDGGDLYDYIMKHDGGLSEELAKKYFRQILRAITYCHQLHVVHRDLKPENVVFFEKLGVVKLTDFGFSNKFSPGQKLETFCGSLAYSAPEILLGDSYDAPAVDIWSLGVILYMLVCGQPPFEKANDSETLTMIMDCKYTVPPQISKECRDLIANMLVRDPKKRATLAEIAVHAWLTQNSDIEPTGDSMPLVSRQQLSEEDHAFIIQKMINGQIASKEEITQSLDKKKYNHITATYFLLAEIRLRKQREELATRHFTMSDGVQIRPNSGLVTDDNKLKSVDSNKVSVVPISINVTAAVPNSDTVKTDKRSRKCSIVREEDEDESSYEHTDGGNELCIAMNRRESISDGRLNRSVQERTGGVVQSQAAPVVVQNAHTKLVVSVDAALAQKLNQIDDSTGQHAMSMSTRTSPTFANRSNDESMQDTLKGLRELEIGKLKPLPSSGKNPVLTHRRSKLNKIRTPSCSSSEASDDDTKTRNKKKLNKFCSDTPTRFRMNRRDSYDDSSDSQDQAFSSGSRGHAAANLIVASNSNKKDGQSHGKDQKQTDDTRKSSHSSHKNKPKQPKDAQERRHLLSDIVDKSQYLSAIINASNGRRRRVRESQSLDRITEAQEFDLRHRHHISEPHVVCEKRNSLYNLSSFSVAETKEEYDDPESNLEEIMTNTENVKNSLNLTDIHFNNNRNKHNIYNISSISEIDLILENRSSTTTNINTTTKTTTTTTTTTKPTKCFVTIKKFRRLGKYFPVVNFS